VLDSAVLQLCAAENAARAALFDAEPRRLEQAAAALHVARAALADANADLAVDARRRRALSLVG